MSSITFSGLTSGLDTNSIVSQLVKAESRPITDMQTQQANLTKKAAKITSLKDKLTALQTAAQALDTRREVLSSKATSSAPTMFTATSTGPASAGKFDIVVDKLAQAGRVYSDPIAARDQAGLFGTGSFDIQVGNTAPISISVDPSDTLDSVIEKINASGAKVTATTLYDGSSFRLQIQGTETGAANALTLSETGVTLGISDIDNRKQQAQDARMLVDGFPVTSSTNVIAGAIPGVTLTALAESPDGTTQSVDITRDDESLKTKIKSFVEAYNAVQSFITAESTFSGVAKGGDSLMGDSTVRSVQSRLRTLIGSEVDGTTGRYTTLASLGIATQRDGTLSVDDAKLTTALNNDAEGVTKVFSASGTGVMVGLSSLVRELTDSGDGLLSDRLTSIDRQKKSLGVQIDRTQSRVDAYETHLRAQFTALESLMSSMTNQGSAILKAMESLNSK